MEKSSGQESVDSASPAPAAGVLESADDGSFGDIKYVFKNFLVLVFGF